MPKYSKPSKKKKKEKIFLPPCLNHEFRCEKHSESFKDNKVNKTVMNLEEFEIRKGNIRSFTPVPEKLKPKIVSPIKLDLQKPRDPFINPENGPNEKRFSYCPSKEEILTKFKTPEIVDFGRMSPRSRAASRGSAAGPCRPPAEASHC